MSLAINGLSHIVSPSLARDVEPDLISKLTHSSPHIRKKAVTVLYKCFLQSPELLRTSWPRLRECLNDDDMSVVSATVNVVCELARRNPKNYLPLAPQLFKLLTDGGNNWMTIKLIKLFATLTPLEPRLTKKLIPPITNLIRTTPAMSLLYECIDGLIAGGLLAVMQDTDEGEELASVCVTKLRGFLVEGDANLKYVGLLALTKLVVTHAHLVSEHQDVILDCIDDADISIRYRALELVVGMANSDSLSTVVGKLMRQLKPNNGPDAEYVELEGAGEDADEDDLEASVTRPHGRPKGEMVALELPEEYKQAIIERIVEMCARDMYANVADFEWYLDVLMQLVRYAPPVRAADDGDEEEEEQYRGKKDVGEVIGHELRNIAVRVRSMRPEAVRCAEMLVSRREGTFPAAGGGGLRVLSAAAWVAGEYARYLHRPLIPTPLTPRSLLSDPFTTFDNLVHSHTNTLPAETLAIYIQSAIKVYATLASPYAEWSPSRKSSLTLLTDRLINFLTPLSTSPSLEVQERAVSFLELSRLCAEAITAQPTDSGDPPLLLTQALPSLFSHSELNPVAPGAQRKVPLPPSLDLTTPINPDLLSLLSLTDTPPSQDDSDDSFRQYYFTKPTPVITSRHPASAQLDAALKPTPQQPTSYQLADSDYLDADIIARRRRERAERNKNDPFYIFNPADSTSITDADIDAIPVLELDLNDTPLAPKPAAPTTHAKKHVTITADEGLGGDDDVDEAPAQGRQGKKGKKMGLLQVDASGLVGYALEEEEEEKERRAVKEVEKLRREMERAAAKVVEKREEETEKPKKKTIKKKKETAEAADVGEKKKKKKKKKAVEGEVGETGEKVKKKKKKEKGKETAEAL